jgi:type I restriction enzyme M protein
VILGPIFLKYVEDAIDERRAVLRDELAADGITSDAAEELLESRDEYAAEGVFWVTPEARWQYLNQRAKQPEIGKLIDNAMDLIEVDNPACVAWFRRSTPGLASTSVASASSSTCSRLPGEGHRGLCQRVLPRLVCASAGAKGRGEFYTHQSVDKQLVEMLEPMNRRVYDGCCGSGGMVVQAEWFVEVDGGQRELLPTSGSSPHTCPSSSASYAGPAWSTAAKPGPPSPTRSASSRSPRSRLHEVINDRIESLTELQTDLADH